MDDYLKNHDHLDKLILNANATTFKEVKIGKDGIDMAFVIGYISRYMFSVRLNEILLKSNGELIHIGGATMIADILYDRLDKGNYSTLKSTSMGFMADNLLVNFANKKGLTKVPYSFIVPGVVNTATVQSQGRMTVFLSKHLFKMIEPEESAKLVAQTVLNPERKAGDFYSKTEKMTPKKSVLNGEKAYEELLDYSADFSGLSI